MTGTRTPRSARKLACRFHGRAWSKTCEECHACLDAGAANPGIRELVSRRQRLAALQPSLHDLVCLAAGVAIGWWIA